MPNGGSTRVCIVQQVVPHYRVPGFDLLARQPGIELSVWSDLHRPFRGLKHAPSTGSYQEVHASFRKIGPVWWQPGQMRAAGEGAGGRYDAIIFSWNARLIHLPYALNVARRAGVPTLLWGHGYSKNESTWRRRRRNALLQRSNGCIVYNHAAADRLVRDGVDRRSVFIALNAIDQAPVQRAVQRWREQPQELAGFQAKHGLGRELVLFVSRLVPEKRVDMLLEAFAIVHQQRPNAQLAIIGRGPEEASLRQRAATLKISSAVVFAGAMYDEMDLAPWFLSARCMAYTVDLGLSILHAFGYALPVVTSDDRTLHGPEVEALRDEHNGLFYRAGDIGHFSEQVVRCLSDAALHERLSRGAEATVAAPGGFCMERMVQGFMDAIRFAIGTRRP